MEFAVGELAQYEKKRNTFIAFLSFSSHDAWIKLDRVIERKDANNANTLFQQQRPRRTSQINTSRQHHLDSTNSNEQSHPPHVTTGDIHPAPTLADDDEQNKLSKSISHEGTKIDESDTDENSQGQNESKSLLAINSWGEKNLSFDE